MPETKVNITLLAPGFPHSEDLSNSVEQGAQWPLWTAGNVPEPWQYRLCLLLGQHQWSADDLPAASLRCRQGRGSVICADPVHLRADRDTATLLPGEMLALSDAEADRLIESLNAFLREDKLQVSRDRSGGWLLSGGGARALTGYPPSFLAHRNASAFLPESPSGSASTARWRRLATELQMLLHNHPVNLERERRGLLPINSLWTWGGADLDEKVALDDALATQLCVVSDEPFARTLADELGVSTLRLDEFSISDASAHMIIVDTRLSQAVFRQDSDLLLQVAADMQDRYVEQVAIGLRAGESWQLDVYNEDGMQGRLDSELLQQDIRQRRAGAFSSGPFATLFRRLSSLAFRRPDPP